MKAQTKRPKRTIINIDVGLGTAGFWLAIAWMVVEGCIR